MGFTFFLIATAALGQECMRLKASPAFQNFKCTPVAKGYQVALIVTPGLVEQNVSPFEKLQTEGDYWTRSLREHSVSIYTPAGTKFNLRGKSKGLMLNVETKFDELRLKWD